METSDAIPSLKVFLVEDSKAMADRLGNAISLLSGIDLVGTTDSEAVAIATAVKDVDVIVLDLHLKQGTGLVSCARSRLLSVSR